MIPGYGEYQSGGWLLFGDGDANTRAGGEDLDTVAHEYLHGIVENRTGMFAEVVPVDGSPALNEAFADFGAAVVDAHQHSGVTSLSTWQIVAINRNNPLDGLRNLWIPKSEDFGAVDWFPSRTQTLSDVSIYRNSTIMGHAFYLLVNGGQITGQDSPEVKCR